MPCRFLQDPAPMSKVKICQNPFQVIRYSMNEEFLKTFYKILSFTKFELGLIIGLYFLTRPNTVSKLQISVCI